MEALKTVQEMLQGWKTYLSIATGLIISIAEKQEWITVDSAETMMTYTFAAGGAALVAKLERWMRIAGGNNAG